MGKSIASQYLDLSEYSVIICCIVRYCKYCHKYLNLIYSEEGGLCIVYVFVYACRNCRMTILMHCFHFVAARIVRLASVKASAICHLKRGGGVGCTIYLSAAGVVGCVFFIHLFMYRLEQ